MDGSIGGGVESRADLCVMRGGPSLPAVSVVIAAYNEQVWLGQTIASILRSGFPCEVVVVNDGSTDATGDVLASWADRVKVVTHCANRGKGAAVASGIRASSGEIIILCDAHLQGLSYFHLLSLVLPLVFGYAREVLGVAVERGAALPALLSPLTSLTGQRAYFKVDLESMVDEMDRLGYGLEVFLLSRFGHEDRTTVLLPGLVHLMKKDTSPFADGVKAYVRESLEVAAALVPVKLAVLNREVFRRGLVTGRTVFLRPVRAFQSRVRARRA